MFEEIHSGNGVEGKSNSVLHRSPLSDRPSCMSLDAPSCVSPALSCASLQLVPLSLRAGGADEPTFVTAAIWGCERDVAVVTSGAKVQQTLL